MRTAITSIPTALCGAGILLAAVCSLWHINSFLDLCRCSDPSCDAYVEGTKRVQLAAYSYDNGTTPMENPSAFMKEFATTIETETDYMLIMSMDDKGLTTFTLADADGTPLESQFVQHTVTCPDNYFEGTVQGLYFGGTCRAPEDVAVVFSSV
jgi:hypothetical protein